MVLLLLDRNSGTPVYRQIVDQIRYQAATFVLKQGQELPSTRALAAEQGVNPMTVSKAYAELERDGVLLRRPGRPHVVATRPQEEVTLARTEELARALEPAVQAACQLEIDPGVATDLFARLLAAVQAKEKPESGTNSDEEKQ